MKHPRVLLVDDEAEFADTLAERLRMRSLSVEVATDGLSALAMIESDPPPVVVLDIMMPGVGGLEVLRRIRDLHPAVEVILLTGRGSTKEGIEGMRLGAFDFLTKPVKIEDLIDRMLAACRKAAGEGEAAR